METSITGKKELCGHEGICLTKYLDSVGVWTIGVGATRTEIPDIRNWPLDKNLSIQEVFDLFDKSLVKYENAVNKALKVEVNQHQYDALVSICYNIGTGGLTKSTFMKRINNRESTQRIVDAIMMWTKPKEITGRRKKEAKLYSTGVYSNGGKALLFPVRSNGKPNYSQGRTIDLDDYL